MSDERSLIQKLRERHTLDITPALLDEAADAVAALTAANAELTRSVAALRSMDALDELEATITALTAENARLADSLREWGHVLAPGVMCECPQCQRRAKALRPVTPTEGD